MRNISNLWTICMISSQKMLEPMILRRWIDSSIQHCKMPQALQDSGVMENLSLVRGSRAGGSLVAAVSSAWGARVGLLGSRIYSDHEHDTAGRVRSNREATVRQVQKLVSVEPDWPCRAGRCGIVRSTVATGEPATGRQIGAGQSLPLPYLVYVDRCDCADGESLLTVTQILPQGQQQRRFENRLRLWLLPSQEDELLDATTESV